MVISGHQRSSVVIRGHQWSSEVISGHQRSSVVIRGHQWSSEVISGPPTCDANEPVVPLVCIDRVQHDARVHRRPHDLRCARHSATVRGASSRGTAQYGARYEPYAAARLWLIGHGEAIEENTARAHLRTYEKLCVLISGHQRSSVVISAHQWPSTDRRTTERRSGRSHTDGGERRAGRTVRAKSSTTT